MKRHKRREQEIYPQEHSGVSTPEGNTFKIMAQCEGNEKGWKMKTWSVVLLLEKTFTYKKIFIAAVSNTETVFQEIEIQGEKQSCKQISIQKVMNTMEEVQTGWYRCPVWSSVSEGLCRWRSVQHMIMAATPTATSAGRTTSTLLMFESPASTQLWAPWLPRKSSMLRAMLHLFHFSFSSKLLFAILFICMSVFPTECELLEGRKDWALFKNIFWILSLFSISTVSIHSELCHF